GREGQGVVAVGPLHCRLSLASARAARQRYHPASTGEGCPRGAGAGWCRPGPRAAAALAAAAGLGPAPGLLPPRRNPVRAPPPPAGRRGGRAAVLHVENAKRHLGPHRGVESPVDHPGHLVPDRRVEHATAVVADVAAVAVALVDLDRRCEALGDDYERAVAAFIQGIQHGASLLRCCAEPRNGAASRRRILVSMDPWSTYAPDRSAGVKVRVT